MTYILGFLLLLGPLIVIHELGHFIVARLLGVKCERFSIGFGPALLRRRFGETEYVLAWLPLGGYVKMLGESPDEPLAPEEAERSFNAQAPWRRIAIALAGPAMNLVLSVVVIAGMEMSGREVPTSLIGSVQPGSAAELGGMQPGDRITAVDGIGLWRWSELTDAVRGAGARPLALEVERDGRRVELEVTPRIDERGIPLLGVRGDRPKAVLGVPDPETEAARAGLRTGDRVTAVGGEPIGGWFDLKRRLAAASGPLEVEIARDLGGTRERARVTLPSAAGEAWSLERLGAVPLDFAVLAVAPASPAVRDGFEAGDVFLRVGQTAIASLEQLRDRFQLTEGNAVPVVVLRDGAEVQLRVAAEPMRRREDGESVTSYVLVGLQAGMPAEPPELRADPVANPLTALWYGARDTSRSFAMILQVVWMLVTREVGINNLAGPIGIGEIAGEALAHEGWHWFLDIMALISVNLAIFNLLPIPILDGGHILFAVAESARGGPLGQRSREIAQTIGLSLVILLMGFAFWNDLSRYWANFVGYLTGS